jgi:PAS domain-containing protein
MSYLRAAGNSLRVKYANKAAIKLYRGENGILTGETFVSFFNNEDDALRFLDMLSIVGQMRAETTVNTHGKPVPVEMHCEVKFSEGGAIGAVYCGQRDLSGAQRYATIIGGSRQEMDFVFNQPFTGIAVLEPSHPVERPEADNVDFQLDTILERIVITRANQAMLDICGTDRAKFLMKPMTTLFNDPDVARQVLKELFVMRNTSVESYALPEKRVERVSFYRAIFDDADRLREIFVAASNNDVSYKARHRDIKGDEESSDETGSQENERSQPL